MRPLLVSSLVACATVACSGVEASLPADAGVISLLDGEASADASEADGGVSLLDATVPGDAAPVADAASAGDASLVTEAAAPSDASAAGEASLPMDAAIPVDAAPRVDAATCASGLTQCGSVCVNLASNAAHCGACATVCTAGQVCVAGSCTRGACPSGTTACGNACVMLATDPANCGRCGNVCAAGQACIGGTCRASCTAPLTACGSACVDLANDAAHCGSCTTVCAAGQACTGGACASACGATVSFGQQVQPIFNAECTGCHRAIAPSGGLPLVSGASYAALVNVPAGGCSDGRMRVKPGSASTSLLYQKMAGSGFCGGGTMPLSGVLAAPTVDVVRRWICQGAPNN